MITFLPYSSYQLTAQCLDNKRLGKQRLETLALLEAITVGNTWSKHPAAKMWKSYESSLTDYGIFICQEWIRRGFKDSILDKIIKYQIKSEHYKDPFWLGDILFHWSHQSNLLRKDPEYYLKFNWDTVAGLQYIWPVK